MPKAAIRAAAAMLALTAFAATGARAQEKNEGGIGRSIVNVFDRTAEGIVKGGRTATRAVGSAMEGTGSLIEGVGRKITGPERRLAQPAPLPAPAPRPTPQIVANPVQVVPAEAAPSLPSGTAYPPVASYPPATIEAPATLAVTPAADPLPTDAGALPPLPAPRPEDRIERASISPDAEPDNAGLPLPAGIASGESAALSDFIATETPRSETSKPETPTDIAAEESPAPAFAAEPTDAAETDPETGKPARVVYEFTGDAAPRVQLASAETGAAGEPLLLRDPDAGPGGMPWSWLALAIAALGGAHLLRRNQGAASTSLAALLGRFRAKAG